MAMSPRLLRPRASGQFDPRTISGLGFWYDFGDTSTVTLDGNNLIQQVNDKSGSGRNLTQTTAANRPGIATVNGRQAADWGSETNVKNLSNVTNGQWRELAVVLVWGGPNPPPGSALGVFSGNGGVSGLLTFFNSGNWMTEAQGSPYQTIETNGVQTHVAFPAILSPSVVAARRATDHSPAWDGIRVGTDRALAGRGWLGKICEIMAWTRTLTADERTAIRTGLARRWKITL